MEVTPWFPQDLLSQPSHSLTWKEVLKQLPHSPSLASCSQLLVLRLALSRPPPVTSLPQQPAQNHHSIKPSSILLCQPSEMALQSTGLGKRPEMDGHKISFFWL